MSFALMFEALIKQMRSMVIFFTDFCISSANLHKSIKSHKKTAKKVLSSKYLCQLADGYIKTKT